VLSKSPPVKRWQHDLWLKIVRGALDGHPDQVSLDCHSGLSQPAAQRYSASSPHLLAWLDQWNAEKPLRIELTRLDFCS
jgi:hypothetical protein